VEYLEDYDVVDEGRRIRYNDHYKKEGVNVNFVEAIDEDLIFVRTYERGVEDETFSCGTGVTAAALINSHNDAGFNHVDIKTKGGNLYVEYDKTGEESFENIWLCGPAKLVFKGSIDI
jgi:diaminopimelate epimerase